ncbi:MAG: 4Fe-4S dicluster domain-containing protein [bacterium]|nr:4Fe-4S dicluster domain-containing protein [bacterium]
MTWIPDSFGSLQRVLGRVVARRQPVPVPTPGLSGTPRLTRTAAGAPRCVACALCAGACPARCIRVEAGPPPAGTDDEEWTRVPLVFELDLGRCLLCGLCAAACPEEAIALVGAPIAGGATEAAHLRLDLEALLLSA